MKETFIVVKQVIGEQDVYAFSTLDGANAFIDKVVAEQKEENEILRKMASGYQHYIHEVIEHTHTTHENHLRSLDFGGVYTFDLHKVIVR